MRYLWVHLHLRAQMSFIWRPYHVTVHVGRRSGPRGKMPCSAWLVALLQFYSRLTEGASSESLYLCLDIL